MAYEESESAILQAFGARMRELRLERTGLSQENFAQKCGLARTYVAGVERGTRNLSLLNICRIAEALGVAPGDLLLLSKPELERVPAKKRRSR